MFQVSTILSYLEASIVTDTLFCLFCTVLLYTTFLRIANILVNFFKKLKSVSFRGRFQIGQRCPIGDASIFLGLSRQAQTYMAIPLEHGRLKSPLHANYSFFAIHFSLFINLSLQHLTDYI